MPYFRKYGTGSGADVRIPIVKRAVVDFAVSADWTPAAGDVKVSKDGGAAANIGTLPTALTMGNGALWVFVFSDSELQCKTLTVTVADSATKAVEDQCFDIETYGHASAMFQADLAAANLPANVVQISGDSTAADNAESFFDGTGYAGTNNVIPTVTTLTNDPTGVTTLLSRIPSGIFTGITSLAQWLGLIAGKQAGNSTARTELRATGAGSGTYDETTDSQEAIRDRGDAAWLTATGFSTHSASDVWAVGTRILTAGTNIQLPSNGLANVTAWTVDITGSLSGSVGSVTGNVGGTVASVVGAVGSVTGNVGGNVTGTVGSLAAQAKADVNAEVDAALSDYDPPTKAELDTSESNIRGADSDTLKTLSDQLDGIQSDLPMRVTKNTALNGFPFFMVDASDHVSGKTGLTVTATRSLDGAAFAACANAVTEIANGWYKIDLAAADLNGNTVALKFTASGADATNLTIVTEPT